MGRDPEKVRRYQGNWYLKNQDTHRQNVLVRKREIAEWYREYRSQLVCKDCGENHPACLDFHHVEPEAKEQNICTMVRMGYSKPRILTEISKCVVLCSNCHRKRHWDERNAEEFPEPHSGIG